MRGHGKIGCAEQGATGFVFAAARRYQGGALFSGEREGSPVYLPVTLPKTTLALARARAWRRGDGEALDNTSPVGGASYSIVSNLASHTTAHGLERSRISS